MISFIEWLVERETREFNMLLIEARTQSPSKATPIPLFKITKKMSADSSVYQDFAIKNVFEISLKQYEKELKDKMVKSKQGINNANLHFANALRHQLTNYNAVLEALDANVKSGHLDRCKRLGLYIELIKQVKTSCGTMLGLMPNSFRLPNEDSVSYQADIAKIIKETIDEKINSNTEEMRQLGCDENIDYQATIDSLNKPEPVRNPLLQQSPVDIAIEKVRSEGTKEQIPVTGNKNAIKDKVKTIKAKASAAGIKAVFDEKTNIITLSM